jgi:integrase/recombinase XerD
MKQPSFEELKQRFAESLRVKNYAEGSIKRYSYSIEDFYEFLSFNTEISHISQIDKQTILDYQKHLYQRPKKRQPDKKIHPTTQAKNISCLNVFFKFLLRQNIIITNPCDDIELPRQQKSLPKSILSKREINKLLSQPNTSTILGYRDRALLELLYSTGLRLNEARNLSIYDINFNAGLVKVNQGKGRQDRIVPLGAIAAEYIRDYIQNIRPSLATAVSGSLLFLNRRGQKISKTGINNIVKYYARKAGLKKHTTTHTLRHTCATLMLKGNADIRHIQEMLGHKSIESTQIYTKVLPLDLKRVHQKTHPREKEAKLRLYSYKKRNIEVV